MPKTTRSEQMDFRGLEILADEFTGTTTQPAATTTTAGIVKQSAAQADSVASDAAGVVTDFNALLAKLRTAGILAT